MAELKCEECDRKFGSEQSLSDHNKSKHFLKKNENNKKSSGSFLTNKYLWIVVGIGVLFLILLSTPAVDVAPGKYDEFAQCLTDNGAKMFGAYWCSHCSEQKKLFGNSFRDVEYIECSLPNNGGQTQDCIDAGIQSYPTWEFSDESRQEGVIALEGLALKTGCELPR